MPEPRRWTGIVSNYALHDAHHREGPSEEAVKAARKALAGVAPYPYPGSLEAALKAAYAAERGGRDA